MKKWLPIILAAVMAVWFLGSIKTEPDQGFHYTDFGRLPILFNGRLQPMDSLARNSLLQIREKQTANLEPWKAWNESPKIIPATEWLAAVMMKPEVAETWPVFRIDNPDLIGLLKLPEKALAKHQDGKQYSWAEIEPSFEILKDQSQRITDREDKKISDVSQRTPFEQAVKKLEMRLSLYAQLRNTLEPPDAGNWPAEVNEYERLLPAGVEVVRAQQAGEKYDQATFDKFMGFARRFDSMAGYEGAMLVPPSPEAQPKSDWLRMGDALLQSVRTQQVPAAVHAYAAMAGAFRAGDVPEFNSQVVSYRLSLESEFPHLFDKTDKETLFNRMEPFYKAMVIYVLAFLLACGSWFNLSETMRRSACWLVCLGFVIHTGGLVFRMWLEGRPPVTNLYSSAIFIGWGAVVLGLVLERFYKDGIGLVVASVMGFLTLIIAHHLALGGDTMEMMRAVLDTNFWLATHVVVVTLGYASTFVAGFLALVYILRGMFTTTLDRETAKSLARMIYGIVCFATLFSFVGTVLGGIWADQSWGRFWGWDPKENGALIIVLWNALVLHLRWGGMVRERGLACCAIFGNIVTSWSWFGVNMLGIGLHSYGFTDAAFFWLKLFVGSQLGLIALGLLPLRMWKSFQAGSPSPASPAGRDGGGKPVPAAS
jgi:ABC-type transport system involved in cytochrome c biogenesis permease subunit